MSTCKNFRCDKPVTSNHHYYPFCTKRCLISFYDNKPCCYCKRRKKLIISHNIFKCCDDRECIYEYMLESTLEQRKSKRGLREELGLCNTVIGSQKRILDEKYKEIECLKSHLSIYTLLADFQDAEINRLKNYLPAEIRYYKNNVNEYGKRERN